MTTMTTTMTTTIFTITSALVLLQAATTAQASQVLRPNTGATDQAKQLTRSEVLTAHAAGVALLLVGFRARLCHHGPGSPGWEMRNAHPSLALKRKTEFNFAYFVFGGNSSSVKCRYDELRSVYGMDPHCSCLYERHDYILQGRRGTRFARKHGGRTSSRRS